MEPLVTIILVVDDHPIARATTAETLKAAGCSAVAAGSLADALETFEGHHADIALVIADAKLSRPHGFRFLQELRAIEPRVPVILTTGADDPDWYEDLDLAAVVRTPIAGDAFTETVRRALARQTAPELARVSGGNGVWRGTPSASGTFATPTIHATTPSGTPTKGGLQSASKEPSRLAPAVATAAVVTDEAMDAEGAAEWALETFESESRREAIPLPGAPSDDDDVTEVASEPAPRLSAGTLVATVPRAMSAGASHGAMAIGIRGAQRAHTATLPSQPAAAQQSPVPGPVSLPERGWTLARRNGLARHRGAALFQWPPRPEDLARIEVVDAQTWDPVIVEPDPTPADLLEPLKVAGESLPDVNVTDLRDLLERSRSVADHAQAFAHEARALAAATQSHFFADDAPTVSERSRAMLDRTRSAAGFAREMAAEARTRLAHSQFATEAPQFIAEGSRAVVDRTRAVAEGADAVVSHALVRLAESRIGIATPKALAALSNTIVAQSRAAAAHSRVALDRSKSVVAQAGTVIVERAARQKQALVSAAPAAAPAECEVTPTTPAAASMALASTGPVVDRVERTRSTDAQAATIGDAAVAQQASSRAIAAAAVDHIDRSKPAPVPATTTVERTAAQAAGIGERDVAPVSPAAAPVATAADRIDRSKPAPVPAAISHKRSTRSKRAAARAAHVDARVAHVATRADRQAAAAAQAPAAGAVAVADASTRSHERGRVDRAQPGHTPRRAGHSRPHRRIVAATVVSLSCIAFAAFFEMRTPTRVASASSVSPAASRSNATSSTNVVGVTGAANNADVAPGANQPSPSQGSGATGPDYAIGSAASPGSLDAMEPTGSLPSNVAPGSTAPHSAPASPVSTTSLGSTKSESAPAAVSRQPTRLGRTTASDDDRSREIGDDEVVPARGENFRREPRDGVTSQATIPENEPDPSTPAAVFSRRQDSYRSPGERTAKPAAPSTSTLPPSPKASPTTGAGSGPGTGSESGSASNGRADRMTIERKTSERRESPSDPLGSAGLNADDYRGADPRSLGSRVKEPRAVASRGSEVRPVESRTATSPSTSRGESRAGAPHAIATVPSPLSSTLSRSLVPASPLTSGTPGTSSSSPASAHAAATAATVTAAKMNVGEEQRIHAALKQYKSAYDRLDANAARAVWPTLDTRALARAFGGLKMQEVEFSNCDLAIESIEATAVCGGSATYVPRVGSQQRHTESREWTFRFKKVDRDWMIVKAETRTSAH